MKINNVRVYDFAESIVSSGFPMMTEFDNNKFFDECADITLMKDRCDYDWKNKHIKRVVKLAENESNSGHLSFLKGIVVNANVTASIKWWEQLQRYNFVFIISSTSTMHKSSKMNVFDSCNGFVDDRIMEIIMELQEKYNKGEISFEYFVYNLPVGFELTARITTNFLQLKNIYLQRKLHKLKEWHYFCDWIKTLPLSEKLITN